MTKLYPFIHSWVRTSFFLKISHMNWDMHESQSTLIINKPAAGHHCKQHHSMIEALCKYSQPLSQSQAGVFHTPDGELSSEEENEHTQLARSVCLTKYLRTSLYSLAATAALWNGSEWSLLCLITFGNTSGAFIFIGRSLEYKYELLQSRYT